MKSHEELGLSKNLYDALVWVRDEFRSGRIEHFDDRNEIHHDGDAGREIGGNMMNMSLACTPTSCGTAACIGGWAAIRLLEIKPNTDGKYVVPRDNVPGIRWFVTTGNEQFLQPTTNVNALLCQHYAPHDPIPAHPLLEQLFHPEIDVSWDDITPQQAADAIDMLLNRGVVDWERVILENTDDHIKWILPSTSTMMRLSLTSMQSSTS